MPEQVTAQQDHRIRFGVQISSRPNATEWRAKVRRAEEIGFSTVLVPDHLDGTAAPWASLATAAAITTHLRVGTYVLNNDLRHPAVVAQEAATLDELSGGRFELGMGAGWNVAEYSETGIPFDRASVRIERLEESVQILKALLAGETLSFEGAYYTLSKHSLGLTSGQPTRVPILIGGSGDRLLTAAARVADKIALLGFHVRDGEYRYSSFASRDVMPKIELIKRAAGSRFSEIELSAYVWWVNEGSTPKEAAESADIDASIALEDAIDSPFTLLGTVEDMVAKLIAGRAQFGISYWIVDSDRMEVIAPVVSALAGRR